MPLRQSVPSRISALLTLNGAAIAVPLIMTIIAAATSILFSSYFPPSGEEIL
jgi:hypothetical protein